MKSLCFTAPKSHADNYGKAMLNLLFLHNIFSVCHFKAVLIICKSCFLMPLLVLYDILNISFTLVVSLNVENDSCT